MPLANNSMVIINSRIIDFVCYTNSSDSNVGYIILPDNKQYHYTEQVHRISPSGIQFHNNNTQLQVNTGIYTCRLPDSNRKILDFNLGVYTSARGMYIITILGVFNVTYYNLCLFFFFFFFFCVQLQKFIDIGTLITARMKAIHYLVRSYSRQDTLHLLMLPTKELEK